MPLDFAKNIKSFQQHAEHGWDNGHRRLDAELRLFRILRPHVLRLLTLVIN